MRKIVPNLITASVVGLIFTAVLPNQVVAVVIDFEPLPDPVGIDQSIGSDTYSEDGFTLTASGGNAFHILGPGASRYIGSKALHHTRRPMV